ncbi:cobyrinate a,c-diamide synthase [Fodinicurvata halophila]|uniref:Cobyrinate a,c-diamide synthase n=1 Tax=Fodinicurvata halophila TaxID=1419723 RepID=A0ABV8UKM4_9PROT
MPADSRGAIIAAPSSGAGKTTITLALLRALRRKGVRVAGAKVGPDYIDPRFHERATGCPAFNLDPWAMSDGLLQHLFLQAGADRDLVLVEGVMGLFDAASNGLGSTADLAVTLGLPAVLVVDVRGQGQSVAALVKGFRDHKPELVLGGIILNRVGSDVHLEMLQEALAPLDIPVLGGVPRDEKLHAPNRHLGLVQASERNDLDAFLETAADKMEQHLDLETLQEICTRPAFQPVRSQVAGELPNPPGQRVAIAQDVCFSFVYPHLLQHWRSSGAELTFFSPLDNEVPDPASDAVYLPGGYPELHAERLSQADRFRLGMTAVVERGAFVYGECGGYMTLGKLLTDARGQEFPMLGFLPLHTSFETPRLHLGYRRLHACRTLPFWQDTSDELTAHEFHYAQTLALGPADSLFTVRDARGRDRGSEGLVSGNVAGSFLHLLGRRRD